jgi:hypothetical protein
MMIDALQTMFQLFDNRIQFGCGLLSKAASAGTSPISINASMTVARCAALI